MNKKGFTLIEVVGVLLILSLIFILVFPNMMNRFNKSRKAINELQKVNIEDILNTYVKDNKYTLENGIHCLNVSELEDGKYIDKQIKKIIDENNIKSFDIRVSDSRVESFDIKTVVCGEENTDKNIKLNGNNTVTLELGENSFSDSGITLNGITTSTGESIEITRIIYDRDGNEVSKESNIITNNQNQLSYNTFNQNSNIQTDSTNNYLVKYEVIKTDSSNNEVYNESVRRKIRVLDTTKPVITVNNEYNTLLITDAQYNLNDLFLIEDASSVTTNIQTNLALGITGEYKVTITVKDQNGNESTKTVYVTVTKDTGIDYVHPTIQDTHKGIVYLNPTNLKMVCNEENSALVGTGVYDLNPSGCKKFYIYDDEGDTYKMIMNYNLLSTCWGTNVVGNVINNTQGWVGNPRNITANEIAHIVGADRNDTIKWDVSKTYKGQETISDVETQKSWIYLDGSGSTYSGWQTQVADSTNLSKYYWLYDYSYGCKEYGCHDEINGFPNGYWTSDRDNPSCWKMTGGCLWGISKNGKLVGGAESEATTSYPHFGIRPVIELPKELFE